MTNIYASNNIALSLVKLHCINFKGYWVLGGALLSEGATLHVALMSIRRGAVESNVSVFDFSKYHNVIIFMTTLNLLHLRFVFVVYRGQDPSVNVVLLEDSAAVVSVAVAGTCMGLSSVLNSPVPDAIGSLLIGGILGTVASFIIYSNVTALVGR